LSDYTKINWNNTDTPISATNLNKMDDQIKVLSDKFPILPADISEDAMNLPRKNLLNILKLKLQMALSSTDIDAWSDVLTDNSLINDSLSSFYSVSDDSLVVKSYFAVTKSPQTAVNDSSAGDLAWSNPDSACIKHSEDGSFAGLGAGTSQYLKASNFGFSIPSNAVINGIQIDVLKGEATDENYYNCYDVSAYIVTASGNISTVQNKKSSYQWSHVSLDSSFSNYISNRPYTNYGGSTDLWGLSWTPLDINSSNFGFAFQALNGNSSKWAVVDHIKITVFYTVPSPTATIIWNSVTPSEALTYIAITSDQSFTSGTINWYISENGTNWIKITSLDTLQAVNFTLNSLHLKCTMTGDAKIDAVAFGGY